jgi:hypothetical protein
MSDPGDLTRLAVQSALSYAERSTAETFLDDRDFMLYTFIRTGAVQLADDGQAATFTRDWVDETWRARAGSRFAKRADDPFPGSTEEFAEGFFKGALARRDALTKRGRARRKALHELRDEWRQTGYMQLGSTLAGILRRSGRP